MNNRIFGVAELNEYIRDLLDLDPVLNGVYVRGELSNYKMYPSGHHYFTMKDAEGALRCVMFKGSASKLRFTPENGMKVIAFGRVAVFPRDGVYQLYASELTPDGVGDLYVAMGEAKKAIPYFQRASQEPELRSLALGKLASAMSRLRMFDLSEETLDEVKLGAESPERQNQLKVLFFDVAEIFESEEMTDRALKFYKKIFRVDASFRNVVDKIEALGG
jgi:tetratricopeptide (TPR) repeat protein